MTTRRKFIASFPAAGIAGACATPVNALRQQSSGERMSEYNKTIREMSDDQFKRFQASLELSTREADTLRIRRLHEFAAWTGVAPPVLEFDDEALLVSDDLLRYCVDNYCSIDWFFCGNVKSLVLGNRNLGPYIQKANEALERQNAECPLKATA